MDKLKNDAKDVCIYHRSYKAVLLDYAVTIFIFLSLISVSLMSYSLDAPLVSLAFYGLAFTILAVMIFTFVQERKNVKIIFSPEGIVVNLHHEQYISPWDTLHNLDMLSSFRTTTIGIRSSSPIVVREKQGLWARWMQSLSTNYEDVYFLPLSPVISVATMTWSGERVIDFAHLANTEFGRELFRHAPQLLEDAKAQTKRLKEETPLKQYGTNPLLVALTIIVLIIFILIPFGLMVLIIVRGEHQLRWLFGIPLSVLMGITYVLSVLFINSTHERLLIYEDGIEYRMGKQRNLCRWKDLSHFEVRGYGKGSVVGIASRRITDWHSYRGFPYRLYNFIPLNIMSVPMRSNGFSDPTEVDTDKFALTAFGRDLMHYAPQLFELRDTSQRPFKRYFPNSLLVILFAGLFIWASFSSHLVSILFGIFPVQLLLIIFALFLLLDVYFVKALDYITSQTLRVYPEGLEVAQGRNYAFAKWEDFEHFELQSSGLNIRLWLHCKTIARWRDENRFLLPFRTDEHRLPLIGIAIPIRYNGCFGPEELDLAKFADTPFGKKLLENAPHLFELGKEKAKNS